MFKSRFRGVYKCGKRWKAQLQSLGVQFYLGTFDTEEEAAKAYDRKARDEKGLKGQTNFDDNGEETINTISHLDAPQEFTAALPVEAPRYSKKAKTSSAPGPVAVSQPQAVFPVVTEMLFSPENSSIQVRMMWERLCQITQRMLLAKAAHEKLSELQAASPDEQKEELLSSLSEEISLLGVVTRQVEGAIVMCVSQGLTAAQSAAATSALPQATHESAGSSCRNGNAETHTGNKGTGKNGAGNNRNGAEAEIQDGVISWGQPDGGSSESMSGPRHTAGSNGHGNGHVSGSHDYSGDARGSTTSHCDGNRNGGMNGNATSGGLGDIAVAAAAEGNGMLRHIAGHGGEGGVGADMSEVAGDTYSQSRSITSSIDLPTPSNSHSQLSSQRSGTGACQDTSYVGEIAGWGGERVEGAMEAEGRREESAKARIVEENQMAEQRSAAASSWTGGGVSIDYRTGGGGQRKRERERDWVVEVAERGEWEREGEANKYSHPTV